MTLNTMDNEQKTQLMERLVQLLESWGMTSTWAKVLTGAIIGALSTLAIIYNTQ